jgi:site-specific recombinase XerD
LTVELLVGQVANNSLHAYQQDLAGYLRFCGDASMPALDAAALARWRQHLAGQTPLSPATINRHLAGVKRVVQEAAVQGYLDHGTAEAFRRVAGVPAKALKERLKMPIRITPAQMRLLCEAPDRTKLGFQA